MSRFAVTVFADMSDTEDLTEVVDRLMAPHYAFLRNAEGEDYNPDGQWDNWKFDPDPERLPARPEFADQAGLFRERTSPAGEAMALPKYMVDFDAISADAREKAAAEWDAWFDLSATYPAAEPRAHFVALNLSAEEAQRRYLAQPVVQAFAQLAATQTHPIFTIAMLVADPVARFSTSRNAYVDRAGVRIVRTYAYLTAESQWHDPEVDDVTRDIHFQKMDEYVTSLAPDTILVVLSCHG